MIPAILAAGAIAGIATNVMGMMASAGDKAKAQAAMQAAVDAINQVGAPPDVAQQIILEKFQSAGILTPEIEQTITQGVSQVSKITENEATKQKQLSALDIIAQRAGGGLTAEDKAAINQAKQQVEQQAQGQQEQIKQEMQQRGMGGSGAELAARLSGSQAQTSRLSSAADQIAAQASANALNAAGQEGSLAGNIRGQDFGVAQAKASAADVVNQFNTQNAIARQQRNVASENQAQAANLGNAQNISNANVSGQNAEYQRQKQAQEWMYNASLDKARALGGALTGQAGSAMANAKDTQQGYANIGSGLNSMGSAFGGGAAGKFDGGYVEGGEVVKGDSPKNDTVPEMLSAHEIVLPKSVTEARDAPEKAKKFVENVIKEKESNHGSILSGLVHLHKRLQELEKRK